MKICLLTHSLPPYVGGCETYVYLLALALHKRGYKVTVMSECAYSEQRQARRYPFKVINIPGFRDFEKGKTSLTDFLPVLSSALSKDSFDVIHVHKFLPALAYAVASVGKSTKTVFTFHSIPALTNKIRGVVTTQEIETLCARFVLELSFYERIVCPCKHYYTWARQMGVPHKKLRLVYPGMDSARFQVRRDPSWRIEAGFAADDFIVLCAARMSQRKGLLDLLGSLRYIPDSRIKFYIVSNVSSGSKEYAESVKRFIRAQRLERRVKLSLEEYDFFSIPRVFAHCDAFVLPSHGEGLPLTILEAMAAGIPVIGSRTHAIDEIVHDGKNGLLAKCADPRDLAARIVQVAWDSRFAEKLVNGGRETVGGRFSFETQMTKLEQIYEN